jgi:OmcA/MtrC family decaheme c-type cytochrome
MNSFDRFLRWALSILIVCTMAFALGACEGDDGKNGAAGSDGVDGVDGVDGIDGAPAPVPDPIAAAIDMAEVESCATCHSGVGDDGHQALYDMYTDGSADAGTNLDMTLTGVTSVGDGAGGFNVTLALSITMKGLPFVDADGLPSLAQKRFYALTYDSVANQYLNSKSMSASSIVAVPGQPGDYTLTQTGFTYAPEASDAFVYGYLADVAIHIEDEAGHVHLYDNVVNTAIAFGTADVTDPDRYVSTANVEGCELCHGTPYMKHGYRGAEAANIPDFTACKTCHYDDRTGGHTEWQYMVDEPFNWATDVAETADYSYVANVMNDTHMSHAMEFPYPQSMANCNTCHATKLDMILTDANFTADTCMSCHPVQGINAWPEDAGATLEGDYAQPHRAPPLQFLWTRAGMDQPFHNATANCISCHSDPAGPPGTGFASTFDEYHSGYDTTIYDASGNRYADTYPVSIDSVTMAGNLLTINFSGDAAIVPEVLVSLYGWDSKNFIIPSHARDANAAECPGSHGDGCQMEYVPGDISPLWTTDAASVAGNWMVTVDFAAFQPTNTDDIPTLIANGDVTMAEINIAPELVVGTTEVALKAAEATFDLGGSVVVPDYFKGANATVDIEKCNACHDDLLASPFHTASGRSGTSIVVCKNCHNPTYPGSHLEMASRSIDSYVHAIHTFQPFDLGNVDVTDPVEVKRTDLHMGHGFPNFTITNCESCHVEGTFNVPDQAKSMPGVLSASDDIPTRSIGTVAEAVTGPASRACGGCHRAEFINADLAGDLASFNTHTEAFGTYVENDTEDTEGTPLDDEILYGIIDKIMSMFE